MEVKYERATILIKGGILKGKVNFIGQPHLPPPPPHPQGKIQHFELQFWIMHLSQLRHSFAKCCFNAPYQFQNELNQTTHRRPCCQTQSKMVHHQVVFLQLKLKDNFQQEKMDLMGSDNGHQLCLPYQVLRFTYFYQQLIQDTVQLQGITQVLQLQKQFGLTIILSHSLLTIWTLVLFLSLSPCKSPWQIQ